MFRAVQIHRGYGCQCLEESVDTELFQKHIQEDQFRNRDELTSRRKKDKELRGDKGQYSSAIDFSQVLLSQGRYSPCSSFSICYVNTRTFSLVTLKRELSVCHETESRVCLGIKG